MGSIEFLKLVQVSLHTEHVANLPPQSDTAS